MVCDVIGPRLNEKVSRLTPDSGGWRPSSLVTSEVSASATPVERTELSKLAEWRRSLQG